MDPPQGRVEVGLAAGVEQPVGGEVGDRDLEQAIEGAGARRATTNPACDGVEPDTARIRAGLPMPREPAYADKRSKDSAAKSASE